LVRENHVFQECLYIYMSEHIYLRCVLEKKEKRDLLGGLGEFPYLSPPQVPSPTRIRMAWHCYHHRFIQQ
jgi:hypothetical protein